MQTTNNPVNPVNAAQRDALQVQAERPHQPTAVTPTTTAGKVDSPRTAVATALHAISPFANAIRVPRMKGKLSNSITKAVMTYPRLHALIQQGFGQGRGDGYKPWIRVTKRNSSPHSNLYVLRIATQLRGLHLLAGTEFRAAHLAAWLGSLEIREQFPLWPHSAPHPLAGLHPERDEKLPSTRGLLAIADEAGIAHGEYVGTDIPYVATTDLVLRIGQPPVDRLVFWSIKPLEMMIQGPRSRRVLERLEMERRYALSVGAAHRVINGTEMNKHLIENLDWLMPLRSEFSGLLHPETLQAFTAEYAVPAKTGEKLKVCIEHATRALKLNDKQGFSLFRGATWLGLTDIDLTRPIIMSRQPTKGGSEHLRSMQQALLGATK